MIAVPITASTTTEAIRDMRTASKSADIIELRLDYIKNPDLEILLGRKLKPVIVTARKKSEGGKLNINEKSKVELLEKAIELGADFVDVELSMPVNLLKRIISKKKKTKTIISYHNFKKTNKREIIQKYNKIKKLNPDIIKIVTFANSIDDNILIFDLIKRARKENKNIIALCMGKKGEISRILSPLFGSYLTFASLKKGKESAPGQLDVEKLKNIYRINKLNKPKIFGLVGNPVAHSKGVILHNKGFEKLGLNNIYVNFLVDDLKSFIKKYKNMISGLSITIPFKREVIRQLDKLEKNARKIGAVNTVLKKNGKLIGYNTDMAGAIKAIESKVKIKRKKVLMIGAGGVARAVAYGVVGKNGKLIVLNRTVSKAKRLGKELKCKAGSLNKLNNLNNIDIIINATSIGMTPKVNQTPINKNTLKKITAKKAVVFDTIYTPRKTKLLKDSKTLGLDTVTGEDMFINQAKEQFRLFTGRELK